MKTIPALATAFMLISSGPNAFAEPISFKGVCSITAGSIGGKNHSTLKCYKKSDPGNYNIRTTKWERRDKAGYRDLVKHAGRRFTCTFTRNGYSYSDGITKNVDLSDCR